MDGTRNMRPHANQFRKMSVLVPGDARNITTYRQRCYRVHTNRGQENIVLLDTALKDGREITIVVTPLNLLGKQNQATLEKAGLPAVAVSKENASVETWSVREFVQPAVKNRRISTAMLHPCAVAAVLHPCTIHCSHSVPGHSNSARAHVNEPNIRVNQGFWGSPMTVLPAAPPLA